MTSTVITFEPTVNGMLPEAFPLTTVVPFTFKVAFGSVSVGVILIELTKFPTVAV